MKTTFLTLLCCLSLVACAQRMDDDNAGDDDQVVNPDPDPTPDPTPDPAICDSDDDCTPIDGCSDAVCVEGTCSSEPACAAGEVCDENLDACVEVVTPPPGSGTITCLEDGNHVYVTVGNGILAHLKKADGNPADGTVFPTNLWKIVYGSNPGNWVIPYESGSTKDYFNWTSDSASYQLQLPNDVTLFNFALTDGVNKYWFDLNEFNVTGSSCAHPADVGGIQRTATPPSSAIAGTIQCRMTTVGSVAKREVTVTPLSGHDIREGLAESPSFLPSPSVIQYGGSDGWTLPYAAGSLKPQLSWSSGTATYTFYLDTGVDDFNFFVVDNDDPSDSWAGGDFFLLDKWTVTNVGSAGCNRVGGGVSIN